MTLAVADAAAAAEQIVLAKAIPLAEAAGVIDQLAVVIAPPPFAEAAAAADAVSTAAAVSVPDLAAAAESLSVQVSVALADQGAAADARTVLAESVSPADQAAAADALFLTAETLPVADAAGAAEQISVAVGGAPVLADAAAAIEQLTASVTAQAADAAAAAEQLAMAAAVPEADAAGAADVISVAKQIPVTLTDAAASIEANAIAMPVALADKAAAVEAPNAGKMETLADAFPGTSVDATKWTSFGTAVAVSGNILSVSSQPSTTGFAGIISKARYDLTGSYALVQLVSAGNQYSTTQAILTAQLDLNNMIQLLVQNGNLVAQYALANTYTVVLSAAYNSTSHKWLRIRESAGTVYFEYSATGTGWTTFTTLAAPFALTSLQASLQEGQYGGADPAATSQWANVNTPPVSSPATVDAGGALDQLAAAVSAPVADTAAAAEQIVLAKTIPAADAAAAADALAVLVGQVVTFADAAAATEQLSPAATVPLADAGGAREALAASAAVPVADQAAGADAFAVPSGTPVSLADAAGAAEQLAVTIVLPLLAETAGARDQAAVSAAVPLPELAGAAEQLTVSGAGLVQLADAAAAAEWFNGQLPPPLPGQLTNRWRNLRVAGGGCCNVFAVSADGSIVMGGSDTQGAYASFAASPGFTRHGDQWYCVSSGLGVVDNNRQFAALIQSGTEPGLWYGGTGETGGNGGLFVFDQTTYQWSLRSSVPQFAGNQCAAPLPGEGWKRSTGQLLIHEPSGATRYLWAGTYKQGVLRSATQGNDDFPVACNVSGAVPGTGNWFTRCIGQAPDGTFTTIYASFYNSAGAPAGLYRCTNAHAAVPNFLPVTSTGAPATVEDMVVMPGTTANRIYCACGNSGIYMYDQSTTTWTSLNGGTSIPNTPGDTSATGNWWSGIDAYVEPGTGNHVLIAGDGNTQDSTGNKGLMKIVVPPTYPASGTLTYTTLATGADPTTIPGLSGESRSWWRAGASYKNWLGGQGFFCPFIWIDKTTLSQPGGPDYYVSGSEGFFRSHAGSVPQMAINGMPMYIGRALATNPLDQDEVIWTTSDWGLVRAKDSIAYDNSTVDTPTPAGAPPMGFSIAYDPYDGELFVGWGAKYGPYNASGRLFRMAMGTSTWTSMDIENAVDGAHTEGSCIPFGLCVVRDGGAGDYTSANPKVVLAACWGSGLWRWTSALGWKYVSTACSSTGTAGYAARFSNVPGSRYIYLFDPKSGIYRSNDCGASWVLLWNETSTDSHSSHVAAHPFRLGEVWVSTDTPSPAGLYKITNAHTGTVGAATATLSANYSAVPKPGPVAINGTTGQVYVVTRDRGNGLGLGLVQSPDGASWADAAGDLSLDGEEVMTNNMVIAADGRIFISGNNIVTQGYPVGLATTVPLADAAAARDQLVVSTGLAPALAERAAAAEALSAVITTPAADAAGAAESLRVAVSLAVADRAAAADVASVQTGLSPADAAAAAERLAVTAALALADQGAAAELAGTSVAGFPVPADAAAATDALAVAITVQVAEAGGAREILAITALLPVTDRAAAADALAISIARQCALADAAAAAEASQAVVTSPYGADQASAVDLLQVTVSVLLPDQGAVADRLAVAYGIALADRVAAADRIAIPSRTLPLLDAAAGADVFKMARVFFGAANIVAVASMQASGSRMSQADYLWTVYLEKAQIAIDLEASLEEDLIAGGRGANYGADYNALYAAQLAAFDAYHDYETAREAMPYGSGSVTAVVAQPVLGDAAGATDAFSRSKGFALVQQKAVANASSLILDSPTTEGNMLALAIIYQVGLGIPATSIDAVTLGGAVDNWAQSAFHTAYSAPWSIGAAVWADRGCAGGATVVAVAGTNLGPNPFQFGGLLAMEFTPTGNHDQSAGATVGNTSTAWSSGPAPAISAASELYVGATSIWTNINGAAADSTWMAQQVGSYMIAGYKISADPVGSTPAFSGVQVSQNGPDSAVIATFRSL